MMLGWQSRKVSLIVYVSTANIVLTFVSNCKIYWTNVRLSFFLRIHLRSLLRNGKLCTNQDLKKRRSHRIHHSSPNHNSHRSYHRSLDRNFHHDLHTFFNVKYLKDHVQKNHKRDHNRNHERLSGFYEMLSRSLSGVKDKSNLTWIL